MLRNLLNKPFVAVSGYNISQNPACVQSVRWRRKPRWIPIARSKIFRVPERHVLPEEEKIEWLRLNNNYKTQMRSVYAFFREENANKQAMKEASLTPADEEAEFQRCSAINEGWNLEIKKIRDARVEQENSTRRAYIKQRLAERDIRKTSELEAVEAHVRKEKEASATFITSENIDQAIENALANPVDFNYSIDLQGNIYRGSESFSKDKKEEKPVMNP